MQNDFIIKCLEKFKDHNYDYSKVNYKNSATDVEIICPVHGSFLVKPRNFIQGKGCKKCMNISRSKTTDEFIKKAKLIHKDKYDYSLVNYTNATTKVKIICPKHGEFEILPRMHISSNCSGCYHCGREATIKDIDKLLEYCENNLDSNLYDWSNLNYKKSTEHVDILCKKHGIFKVLPNNLYQGQRCYKCALENRFKTTEQFIIDANKVHNNRFDYSKTNYKGAHEKVEIICPDHGSFIMKPNNHLNNKACPKCSASNSGPENKLVDYLNQFIAIDTKNRNIINPYELDIVIPSKRIAIEVNGLYWHAETNGKGKKYHLNKTNLCSEKGYRLVHIFEDELFYKNKIVKSRLKHLLGLSKYRIFARKCIIKELDNKTSKIFQEKYHIQGPVNAKINLGLFYKNRLVAVMTFGKSRFNKKYEWELLRYCTLGSFNIIGGASKLLKYFRRNNIGSIISYADKRWSIGNLYKQLGFEELKDSDPNYFYVKRYERLSRNQFQKHKLKDKLIKYDENLSEYENMRINGYNRIWDCGNKVYVLE